MGRKIIKSNRHKKLKAVDPFYVGDRKLCIDKKLAFANQAPKGKDEEDQRIPSKLREMMELKDKLAKERINAKKKKEAKQKIKEIVFNKPDEKGAEMPLKPVPEIKKNEAESERAFLNRVDNEVDMVLNRSKYETQYDCKLEVKDGEVVVKKEKKMREGKKRKLEKLKDKIKYKKIKNQVEQIEFDSKFKDNVKFGETVHQPPVLNALPKIRKKYADSAENVKQLLSKPGKKDLLLKKSLENNDKKSSVKINFTSDNQNASLQKDVPKKRKKCLTIPKKTKTPHGLTESDRSAVIDAYRKLKKSGKFE